MKFLENIKYTPALIFLILVNFIPVFGVFLLHWDIATIIVIYWLETIIIGFLNVPKMWACEGSFGLKIYLTIFFAFHFGMFSWGHYTFLNDLFGANRILSGLKEGGPIVWTVASLFVSHLFSLFFNFYRKREYVGRLANSQMFFPYGRIVVMHIMIIIGGFLVMMFGAPIFALLMLVVLKIAMDVIIHTFVHEGVPQELKDWAKKQDGSA